MELSAPSKGRGAGWWIAAVLVAAVLLYYSLRGVDWRQVGRAIAGAHWGWLAPPFAIACFSYFLRALRWRVLLNAEEHLGVGLVFRANMSGYLGNSLLPARAGELVRVLAVSRRSRLSTTYVLTTAVSERLMDAIALVLWSSVVLLGVDPKPRWIADVSGTTAAIAAAGALAITVLPHCGFVAERLIKLLPLPAGIRERLLRLTEQVLLGVRAFHDVRRFLAFAALTVAIWSCDATGVTLGGMAFGIRLSFGQAMLLITGLGMGSALPATPGYVGIYQFVAVTVLVPFGISRDVALAYIIVAQALGYAVTLTLGIPSAYGLRESAPYSSGSDRKVHPASEPRS